VIVNLQHKDLEAFLEDAKAVFVIKINRIVRSLGAVKVNTTQNCDFTKQPIEKPDEKAFFIRKVR